MAQRSADVWLWSLAALLCAAVAGSLGYKYWRSVQELPVTRAMLSVCDLQHGPCTTTMEQGKVTLRVAPRPIPVVTPLQLQVETDVPDIRGVEVDFSGVDMNMGRNRFQLRTNAEGHYAGEGMLPVCVRNRMRWEATVMLHTGDVILAVPYRFDTVAQR